MPDIPCLKCQAMPDDVADIVTELMLLRISHYRGTIELHLDGSGRIKSRKKIDFREVGKIKLTSVI